MAHTTTFATGEVVTAAAPMTLPFAVAPML